MLAVDRAIRCARCAVRASCGRFSTRWRRDPAGGPRAAADRRRARALRPADPAVAARRARTAAPAERAGARPRRGRHRLPGDHGARRGRSRASRDRRRRRRRGVEPRAADGARRVVDRLVEGGVRGGDRAAALPGIDVQAFPVSFTGANADALVAGWDVVVDGFDTFGSRYLASDATTRAGVPHVWGRRSASTGSCPPSGRPRRAAGSPARPAPRGRGRSRQLCDGRYSARSARRSARRWRARWSTS